jgi:hypothetical protein
MLFKSKPFVLGRSESFLGKDSDRSTVRGEPFVKLRAGLSNHER